MPLLAIVLALSAPPESTNSTPPAEIIVALATPPARTSTVPLLRMVHPLATWPDDTAEVWPLLTITAVGPLTKETSVPPPKTLFVR